MTFQPAHIDYQGLGSNFVWMLLAALQEYKILPICPNSLGCQKVGNLSHTKEIHF